MKLSQLPEKILGYVLPLIGWLGSQLLVLIKALLRPALPWLKRLAEHPQIQALNPFTRPPEAANPYATQRIEDNQLARDFTVLADKGALAERPIDSHRLIRTIGIALGLAFVWSIFAHVNEITRGEGKVIPSRQLQVVQSLDGGIVSAIHVKEGEGVRAGQVLLSIDTTRFMSGFKENQAAYLALLAKSARLRALAEGKPYVAPPQVKAENPALAAEEGVLYANRKAELDAQLDIARQQLAQRNHELSEARARNAQATQALDLTNQELTLTRPLRKMGAVSDVEILRLERDVSRYAGEKSQTAAQITRLQAAASEATRKIEEVELDFKNRTRAELAETDAKIQGLEESSVALSDKVKQAEIRSPVNGTVKRILYNTEGGVVQPGKDIVEIVPLEDALLLEARVQPRDIAFLHPGQRASVKLTAYDFTIYGGLDGTLEHISPDSVIDEKGNAFYVVRVKTTRPNFGENMPIIPGMTAQVDILTGEKSVLSYLLKPLLRAKQYSFTER